MKQFITLLILWFGLTNIGLAQFPSYVTEVELSAGKTVTAKGKLENGQDIEDLSWAERSSVACFPGTQNTKFRNKHVFFATEIPTQSILEIKLVPNSNTADFSLYAYQVGLNNYTLPPDLGSCVSCEADHKWDYPKKGKTQDHTRFVKLNATTNPYRVVIGVSAPEGQKGEFSVELTLKQ